MVLGQPLRCRYMHVRSIHRQRPFSTRKEGYQSIGSFHSDNLAEIMAMDDSTYQAPALPFEVNEERVKKLESRDGFMVDFENWTFLNHGAFGGALATGYVRAEQWRRHLEEQPLRYFDRDLLPHLAYSARALADFVVSPSKQNVSLLSNVTSGLNAVLAGHCREFGASESVCIVWDISYGSVKKMAQHYYGGNVLEIPFQSQYLDQLATCDKPEQIFVNALHDFFSRQNAALKNKHICLVLDQTTSNTALTLPLKLLSSAMKEIRNDSLVVVDGAHGLLAQDTNLTDLFASGVDIYLSNGHKWLSAPRGVALMAIADVSLVDSVLRLPAVLSHGVDEPDFFSRYIWDGCRDYSAALSVPAVLKFWDNPDDVRKNCKQMLRSGIQMLAQEWYPSVADDVAMWPGIMTLASIESSLLSQMALVSLPPKFGSGKTSVDAKQIQDHLYSKRVEVPVKCINGKLFLRISSHIYNRPSDFENLCRATAQMP